MANRRKAFHFDLDEDRLKSLYPSESKTGYKSAWGKIQAFMEANGFEHTQYSGYESIHGMSYLQAYKVLEGLQKTYPWFKDCAQVATLTEIGKRHDVLEHLGNGKDIEEPDVSVTRSLYGSRTKLMPCGNLRGHWKHLVKTKHIIKKTNDDKLAII